MNRRGLRLLSLLSLPAGVAVVALWVRSYCAVDAGSLSRYRCYGCMSASGRVSLWVSTACTWRYTYDASGRSEKCTSYAISPVWTPDHRDSFIIFILFDGASFACARDESVAFGGTVHTAFGETMSYVCFPHWCLAAAFSLPAVGYMLSPRQGRRRNLNLCPECGYNLTGNVSRVCPECGEPAR